MSITKPTVNVASGYWNNTMPTQYNRTNLERQIGMALAKRSNRGLAKVWRALTGAAPGAAVTDTVTRIQHPAAFSITNLGGVRTVETVATQYNGNTTAAQETYIETQIIDPVIANQTYPVDLGGNGGGGKLQK